MALFRVVIVACILNVTLCLATSHAATAEVAESLAATSASLVGHAPVASATASLPGRIGVAAAVKGSVQALFPGQAARNLVSGSAIFQGDKITTGPQAHMQILLQDETTVTVGANSAIVMDEFIYDPETSAGKVGASVAKGVFRFVTGKVAHKDPKKMKVKLPVGTIGVRGTVFAVQTDGFTSQVVLLGPGPDNNAGERAGAIYVETEGGSVDVTQVGYGTEVSEQPAEAPAPAELIPAEEMDALYEELEVSAEESAGEETEEASNDLQSTEEKEESASSDLPTEEVAEQEGADQSEDGQTALEDSSYESMDDESNQAPAEDSESYEFEEEWAQESAAEESYQDMSEASETAEEAESTEQISEELGEETNDSAQDQDKGQTDEL